MTSNNSNKNNYLSVNKINIPLDKVNLDIYTSKGEFMRYHLWDSNGLFAIFSVFEDDLCIYFQEKHINQTLFFEEISSKNDGGYISLKSNNRKLNYNIEVGSFTLKENNTETISLTPEVYVYDPKYKQGKPLLKK